MTVVDVAFERNMTEVQMNSQNTISATNLHDDTNDFVNVAAACQNNKIALTK